MMALATSFQPLYKQVYDLLTNRLVSGAWKPAEPIPSEMALAEELGVSQGTVRKALNQMVAKKLLERQQGKGTFVAEHTQESSLFRFFRLRESHGESLIPKTEVLSVKRRPPDLEERSRLQLACRLDVVELVRLRNLLDKPTVVEKIIQPLSIFPDIDQMNEIPNSLYTLYQDKYGISIVEAQDEVSAVPLPPEYAMHLGLAKGSPVLKVERTSINIDGRIVEWSQAYCATENFVYSVNLE